jgi:23S rRNA (adenine2030-N6)-methyltransferase
MNYRHAYHAGNHADVLKHAVLAGVVHYLAQKDKAFAVLDAHAGLGVYDLQAIEAAKTGEWQGGIGLMQAPFAAEVEEVLAPYRRALGHLNPDGAMRLYPGSPEIILGELRAGDRLLANELHAQDFETLKLNYAGEKRLLALLGDAGQAVKAQLPFRERRGLVLIDPPYEGRAETEQVARMLAMGAQRFPTGLFIIWYPVTTEEFVTQFMGAIKALGIGNLLRAELRVKTTHAASGLSGSGLLILNPPFNLRSELEILLPALAGRLGIENLGRSQLSWLTPPKG